MSQYTEWQNGNFYEIDLFSFVHSDFYLENLLLVIILLYRRRTGYTGRRGSVVDLCITKLILHNINKLSR